jgi:protein-S-isoprenylcysteine O-methyltransferase Ste14
MITSAIALILLVVSTAGIERSLRRTGEARTLAPTRHDSGSQRAVGAAFGVAVAMLLVGAALGAVDIARMPPLAFAGGIAAMAIGAVVRYSAMRTLGRFYTRTLRVTEAHRVVDSGLYRYVRHPGYLGMILVLGGADLATADWVPAVIGPVAIIGLYLFRIRAEEAMLNAELGADYATYSAGTWRLIPHLF